MTAFLFMPSASDTGSLRRVDFGRMASLFREIEQPPANKAEVGNLMKIVGAVLILLCALGDSILIAPPDALASCLSKARHAVDLVAARPSS